MKNDTTAWDHLPIARVPFGCREMYRKFAVQRAATGLRTRLVGSVAARLGLLGITQTSWLLDLLVAPGWRKIGVHRPIFIIGHQRSGTTLMHRLLAADRTHARALCLHEMLQPAISFQRGLGALQRLDQALGGRGTRWLWEVQDHRLGPMDAIHRLRLQEIEEDEFVFWAIFASAMCINDTPETVVHPSLQALRHFNTWPLERQQAVLGWYRACLMKKLYREPGDGPVWIVAKNPAFSQKIPVLRKVFPDARFIHLWRDPLETIPSRLSLIRAIWRARRGDNVDLAPEQVELIVADSLRTCTHAPRDLQDVPAADQITIDYESFIGDVPGTIRGIYDHFHLSWGDVSLQNALEKHAQRGPRDASDHVYSLAEFGLDAETLKDRLDNGLNRS